MRGIDRERVLTEAQFDIHRFEVLVAYATIKLTAGNNSLAAHTQTADVVFGEHALIVGGAVAIEQIECIDLHVFGNPLVEIDRIVEIRITDGSTGRLASERDRVTRNAGQE